MRTSWIVPPDGICALIGTNGSTIETRATATASGPAKRTRLRKTPPRHEKRCHARGVASGDQTLDEFHDPQVHQVVPGGEDHQRQHQGKADPQAVFLAA